MQGILAGQRFLSIAMDWRLNVDAVDAVAASFARARRGQPYIRFDESFAVVAAVVPRWLPRLALRFAR